MAQPRLKTFPQIRRALRFYQIASVITGVGLLLLVAEMVLKYTPIAVELFAGGPRGFLHFDKVIPGPGCTPTSMLTPWIPGCEIDSTGQGVNISLLILMIHGWFYVVYLLACFRVWSLMRWPFVRLLLLAGGGVVPFLSFIMEVFVVRDVRAYLAGREERAAAKRAASESPSPNDPLQEAAQ
jgi:integral membrane protein